MNFAKKLLAIFINEKYKDEESVEKVKNRKSEIILVFVAFLSGILSLLLIPLAALEWSFLGWFFASVLAITFFVSFAKLAFLASYMMRAEAVLRSKNSEVKKEPQTETKSKNETGESISKNTETLFHAACPKCGSQDWKLASFVHASGTSAISTTTIGSGVGVESNIFGGGVGTGVGVGNTSGKQQTELAKLAAPPVKEMRPAKSILILFLIAALISLIFSGIRNSEFSANLSIFFVALAIVSAVRIIFTPEIGRQFAEKNKKEVNEYTNKRMCTRCGTLYYGKSIGLASINERDKQVPPNSVNIVKQSTVDSNSSNNFSTEKSPNTKKCPFCAEEVRAEAILCKHCHSKI